MNGAINLNPPRQRRSQDTLDAISSATRTLLRTRSFRVLTIQDIVKAANSSAGSFYARFKGKRALLHYLHEEMAVKAVADMQAFIDAAVYREIALTELAGMLIPNLVRFHTANRGVLRAMLVEALEDPVFIQRAGRMVRSLAELIAAHTQPTRRSRDQHVADVEQAFGSVIAILDQSLFYQKRSPRQVSEEEIARLQRIFLASLGVEG